MNQYVSAYLIKIRRVHPFFATLSLYMDFRFTDQVETFDCSGYQARINPNYFSSISSDERAGTLLHVTLHCALQHQVRCGDRVEGIWNIASDIVVNNIILEGHFFPPPRTAVETQYAENSAEFIYLKLLARAKKIIWSSQNQRVNKQGSDREGGDSNPSNTPSQSTDLIGSRNSANVELTKVGAEQLTQAIQVIYPSVADITKINSNTPTPTAAEQKKLEGYWKNALLQASAAERVSNTSQGLIPEGLKRSIDEALNPQLNWRAILWRFMSKTPCNFSGFDRRFVHQGLYLEQLEGESLTVYIAIDTSGSIGDGQLAQFRAEVESIIRCYSIRGRLYFVDAEVYGPYPITQSMEVVLAEGGGGTDFSVFFEKLNNELDPFEQALCIYLTDGYGTFPSKAPDIPVLWIATDDTTRKFPFGEVAKLA